MMATIQHGTTHVITAVLGVSTELLNFLLATEAFNLLHYTAWFTWALMALLLTAMNATVQKFSALHLTLEGRSTSNIARDILEALLAIALNLN